MTRPSERVAAYDAAMSRRRGAAVLIAFALLAGCTGDTTAGQAPRPRAARSAAPSASG